ncbi:MAG: BMC domain-containing protein [Roseburia sp.]|nr:BMC domain-containing protein [Roseburia sp.]
MRYGAYGLVEVLGASNAVIVADQMLKTSEVEYITQDTKCGGHALVFVGGDVAAVTAAIEKVNSKPACKIFASAVISNPSEEMIEIVEQFKARRGGR